MLPHSIPCCSLNRGHPITLPLWECHQPPPPPPPERYNHHCTRPTNAVPERHRRRARPGRAARSGVDAVGADLDARVVEDLLELVGRDRLLLYEQLRQRVQRRPVVQQQVLGLGVRLAPRRVRQSPQDPGRVGRGKGGRGRGVSTSAKGGGLNANWGRSKTQRPSGRDADSRDSVSHAMDAGRGRRRHTQTRESAREGPSEGRAKGGWTARAVWR